VSHCLRLVRSDLRRYLGQFEFGDAESVELMVSLRLPPGRFREMELADGTCDGSSGLSYSLNLSQTRTAAAMDAELGTSTAHSRLRRAGRNRRVRWSRRSEPCPGPDQRGILWACPITGWPF